MKIRRGVQAPTLPVLYCQVTILARVRVPILRKRSHAVITCNAMVLAPVCVDTMETFLTLWLPGTISVALLHRCSGG